MIRKLSFLFISSFIIFSCSNNVENRLISYWEKHDFFSLEHFNDINFAEQKFEGYVDLLNQAPFELAENELKKFVDSAKLNEVAYMVWMEWFEIYLHDLTSPYKNDELFEVWLNKALETDLLDDFKIDQLKVIQKTLHLNRVGSQASDVLLKDFQGNNFRISDLKGSQHLLLLLDADCSSCYKYLSDILDEYKTEEVELVAILINATPIYLKNIAERLDPEVFKKWRIAWCPGREIEKGEIYDLTYVPSKLLISEEGIVLKSYHN